MPSTAATWILRCNDKKRIDRLIKDLELIANLHKDIIEANWNSWAVSNDLTTFLYKHLKRYRGVDEAFKKGGHGPGLKEIIKKDHQEYAALVANIKDRSKLLDRVIVKYDEEIKGKILIDKGLFEPDFGRSKCNNESMSRMQRLYEFNFQSEEEKRQMTDEIKADYVETDKVKLYGFQFRFYEHRWPMSGYDQMSLVFAKFPEFPELNGLCIEVHDKVDNAIRYKDPYRAKADYIIKGPNISLRYLNEDVIFRLLTWINFFHFPEIKFDFGYGNNHKVKHEEINEFYGHSLLKNKALIELLDYSYQEYKNDIDTNHISNIPLIDHLFEKLISPERLSYRRKFLERAFGKTEKMQATFDNTVIYSDLHKIAEDYFVGAPYFCEACGLHFGLSLERSIAAVKYIHSLRISELKASGFYFDIDLSKTDDENFKSKEDFKNFYFHAMFCGFCDSEKKWIEMRPL
jgi:hypothetical protein